MGQYGQYRPLVRLCALAFALACGGGPVAAECRLALILALDVSSSVDAREDALQRQGLAAAMRDEAVRQAFFATPYPVALAAFEWSGRYNQSLLLDWTLIDTPAALETAAQTISRSQRQTDDFPTAIGYAMGFAAGLFRSAPPCLARTVDVAGDGSNNEGFPPRTAYDAFGFDGITVNGLVVNAAEFESETQLIQFYQQEVLHGPGAFLEVAQGFEDFERAMRRKLEREVRPATLGRAAGLDGHAPG